MFFHTKNLHTKILAELLSFSIITSNVMIPSVALAAAPSNNQSAPVQERTQRLIIKLRENFGDADASSVVANVRGSLHRSLSALRRHVLNVPQSRAATILALLKQDPRIESVEADQSRHIADTPSDSAYTSQWALPKIGWDQVYGIGINGTATLAVLDTGVQSGDLTLVPGWSAFGSDPTLDTNGHGTAVASIAAATTNNATGIAGVAFSNVSIMPIQVLGSDGTGQDSDVIEGITWAVDNGANVIVMAFSAVGYSSALQDAVNYAWQHGVVVVAAAGNDASATPAYPAGDINTIGVGATDQNDAMWSGSNISPAVFITAPGVEIAADTPNADVQSVTGTSASAAMVAGAAALLKAYDNSATPGIIANRLATTADPAGMANGRLNIAKAIANTDTTEIAPAGAPYGGPYVGPYNAAANRKVTVTLAGIQQATISGDISCNASNSPCTSNVNTTQSVVLTVNLFPGATFTGWSGACSGTNLTCTIPKSSSDQAATATIGGKYQSTTTVTCNPSSVVYNATAQTPCSASWSSPQPASGSLTPSYVSNTSVGTATANASFAGNANNTASNGSATFQITAAPLTVNFTVANRNYDGTKNAAITGCTLSGVLAADANNVSCDFTGASAILNNASVGSRTATGTGFTLTGSAASNYSISTINTANATISALPLTVSFSASSKTYNASTSATITGCSLAGVIGADNVSCGFGSATANFIDKNVGNAKTVNASGFTLTGTAASNYSVGTVNSAQANITALALSLTFASPNKVYDATTAASVSNCSVTGVLSGDTVGCSFASATATFANKNVGTNKTVTGVSFSLTGASASNYSIAPSYTTTANITQRPLTVSAAGVNKVYDRTTAASVTLSDNRISGDVLSESYTSATFATSFVGTGKTITVSGISLSGTDSGNYSFNTSTTTTANITQKGLTINFSAANKVYDGTNTASLSNCSVSGVVSGDTVSCDTTNVAPTFSDKSAGSGKTVTGTNFAIAGANAGNYALASTTATTLANISPRALTISATGINKGYDGNTTASVSLSDDRIFGDILTTSYISANFVTPNAGIGKTVNVSGISLGGLDASNYTFNTTATTTANIAGQAVSILFTANDKTYDGTNGASVATCSVTGVISGDHVDCNLTGVSTQFSDKNAGAGKIVTGTGFAISGPNAANYTLSSQTATALATIQQRALHVTASGENKNYDGFASATVTLSDDRVTGDALTTSYASAAFADASGGTNKSITVSGISATGNDANNYTWNPSTTATADIIPVVLTVTADDQTKLYGDANPALTATITGFILGETLLGSDVLGVPTCTTTATTPSAAGSYPITCTKGTLTSSNYAFAFAPGTLHVNPAPLVITADANPSTPTLDKFSRVYGSANPSTYSLRFDGFVNNETSAVLSGAAVFATTAVLNSPVSDYPVTVSGLSSTNYAITFVPGILSVTQATLSVDAEPQTKSYGAADPALTYHYTGLVAGDSSASETGAPVCSREAGETAGTYAISCDPATLSSTNYKFVKGASALLTITQAVLSVEAEDATKTYGENDPSFTYHFSGYSLGDSELTAGISGTAACHRTAGEGVGASPYIITCESGSLASDNYTFATGNTANLTIQPAILTVKAEDQSRLYGAANPSLSTTISGFAFNETLETSDLQGAASCSTTAIATSPVVASGYPITCTVGSLNSTNYVFTFAPGTLHVNPAPLTITPDAAPGTETLDKFSRVYGAANPSTYALRYDGFVNDETATVLGGTAAFATTAILTSPVGDYPVTVNGLTSTNYAITFAPGTLSVTQATLLVDAEAQSKTYGADDPTLTFHFSGFVAGDSSATETGAPVCSREAGETAGTHAISCDPGTLASTNYKFAKGASALLTIGQAVLNVDAEDATKTYGDNDPAFTYHFSGYVSGDDATSSAITGSANCHRVAGEGVGASPYAITCDPGTLASQNYSFATGANANLTINPATLTVTADDQTRLYGAASPSLTATLTGFAFNEILGTSDVQGTAACTTSASANSPVAGYPISCTVGTLNSTNYVFTFAPGTLHINPAPLTITPDAAPDTQTTDKFSRLYGSANPSTYALRFDGFVNNETSAVLSGTPIFATTAVLNSPVGDYPVTVSGLTSTNYAVTFAPGTLSVTQATLSVDAEAQTKTYGATDPALTFHFSGFVAGDSTASETGAPVCTREAGEAAGTYAINCDPGTLASTNYKFVKGASALLSINQAVLSVEAEDASKTYGDTDPAFTYHFTGYALGDSELTAGISGTANCHRTAGEGVGASPYTITCDAGSLASANYTFATGNTASLIIQPKILNVKADDKTRLYGSANPSLTATLSGFSYNETLETSDVHGLAACITNAVASSPVIAVGYPITCTIGTLSSTNYVFTFAPGTLHVNQAPLTITPDADPDTQVTDKFSRVYGSANPNTYALRYDGFVNNESSSVLSGNAAFVTTAGLNSAVGDYPVTVNGLTSTNYAITFAPGTLSVTQATLAVDAEAQTKTYGADDPTLTFHFSGFVAGDSSASETGAPVCSREAGETAGTYAISCDPGTLASTNYKFAKGASALLTISQAVLNVDAESTFKVYGSNDPSFTYHFSGYQSGDNQSTAGISGNASCHRVSGEGVGASPYAITCDPGTLSSQNYSFATGARANLAINPATLTVAADDQTRLYGAANPLLTATISGFVLSEQLATSDVQGTASCSTVATSSSPVLVGGYAITCTAGSLSSTNYTFTFAPGTMHINPAPLTITPDAVTSTTATDHFTKIYGQANPIFTARYDGLVNGDTPSALSGALTFVSSATTMSPVGTYTVTASGQSSTNYTVGYAPGTLDIGKASIAVNANVAGKTYGSADPVLAATLVGYVGGENMTTAGVTGNASCTRTPGEDAGAYTITCSPGSLAAANYSFSTGATAMFTINKATLSVVALDAFKTYGSADPSLSWTYSGMVGTDSLELVTLATTGSASCTRSSGETVGTYSITCAPGSLWNANYNFATGTSATFTINKATLAVNEANDLSKVYGSADPTFTYNLVGFKRSDNANNSNITGNGVCSRNAGESVGSYTITCVPGTLGAPNYNFVQGTTGVFKITKATLSINATAASKTMNASDPAFTWNLSGFLRSDNASNSSIAGSPSCTRTGGETVGTYTITCSAGSLSAPNYSFATGNTAPFSILYAFTGFTSPVNMTAVNVGNAGKAIPLKFTVTDAAGKGVTSLPNLVIYQQIYQCGYTDNMLSNDLSVYATGASGLQNLGGGVYQFNWNTDKNYKGSCRQIQLNVGDGVIHVANFQFN